MTTSFRSLNLVGRRFINLSRGYGYPYTFSRASAATRINPRGLVEAVASGVLRHDFDPGTTAYLGLLTEEQRTNYVQRNRDLSHATWTKTNVTAAKNQTGVDGVSNSASSITATSGNGTVLQAITDSSRARYQTAYVKRLLGSSALQMTMDNGSTWTTVTLTGIGPNGYTRVAIPGQTLSNPTVGFRIVGNGDSFAIDYVQNEGGAFATSAIETAGAAATRSADLLSLLLSAFAFNPEEGTLFAVVDTMDVSSRNGSVGLFWDGSGPNYMELRLPYSGGPSAATLYASVASSLVVNNLVAGTSLAANQAHKLAFAYKASDWASVANGGTVSTQASGAVPGSLTELLLGNAPTISGALNGHIRLIRYYPRRLTNAELQLITL